MDCGIDGRAGAAGEEEGPVQKTESGKFKLTHYLVDVFLALEMEFRHGPILSSCSPVRCCRLRVESAAWLQSPLGGRWAGQPKDKSLESNRLQS